MSIYERDYQVLTDKEVLKKEIIEKKYTIKIGKSEAKNSLWGALVKLDT